MLSHNLFETLITFEAPWVECLPLSKTNRIDAIYSKIWVSSDHFRSVPFPDGLMLDSSELLQDCLHQPLQGEIWFSAHAQEKWDTRIFTFSELSNPKPPCLHGTNDPLKLLSTKVCSHPGHLHNFHLGTVINPSTTSWEIISFLVIEIKECFQISLLIPWNQGVDTECKRLGFTREK